MIAYAIRPRNGSACTAGRANGIAVAENQVSPQRHRAPCCDAGAVRADLAVFVRTLQDCPSMQRLVAFYDPLVQTTPNFEITPSAGSINVVLHFE